MSAVATESIGNVIRFKSNDPMRVKCANELALQGFKANDIDTEDAKLIVSFILDTNIDIKVKAAGILAYSLTQAYKAPKWCFDTAISCYEMWNEVGSIYNSKYIYKKGTDTQYNDTCPVCGSDKCVDYYCANQLLVINTDNTFLPVKLWMKCNDCGNLFAYNFPIKSMSLINGHYTKNENESFIQPQHSMRVFGDILNRCKEYSNGRSYLEVGIGLGEMMAAALEMGFDVDAVEICREDCERIYSVLGVNIMLGDFLDIDISKRYDVIIMGDVLEHMLHPEKAIKKALSLLNEDGVLWVSTPNYNSGFTRMMKFNDPMWNQKNHYTYFSYETILPLIERYGGTVMRYDISNRYNGSMELYITKK